MPYCDAILASLQPAGLGSWQAPLTPLLQSRFADGAHGDLGKWRTVIDQLPVVTDTVTILDSATVTADSPAIDTTIRNDIRQLLLQIGPWRKGPFNICGIDLDSEWRSDLKWNRLEKEITPLSGRRILDVGCGNGYYAFRMTGAGAQSVVGIDPTLLFVFQFLALNHFMAVPSVHVLPLRLNELPITDVFFDTAFSMGVLYHQREPLEHLAELRAALRPGGELVLETLIYPGSETLVHRPEHRYARMRNVWHLPTATALEGWLRQSGFTDVRLVDVTVTTASEQRSTEWMPFESLAEALDPDDPGVTVEGLPAPVRALIVSTTP